MKARQLKLKTILEWVHVRDENDERASVALRKFPIIVKGLRYTYSKVPRLFLERNQQLRYVPRMMRELFAVAHERFSKEQTKFRQVEFDTDARTSAHALADSH